MILDKLTASNLTLVVLIKMFVYNFIIDTYFRGQVLAIAISLLFIGIAWFFLWLYVLQRFKFIKDIVDEFIINRII